MEWIPLGVSVHVRGNPA
ncbi:Protein of unknown function [Bacillus mycoides]|uniref:Uncharacterized protein n=1 Tax=Bacillus mycoides TaxID=1405 RepID=A0A1G4ETA1_BACMY|nr:Protein of unknown function [Bacillus mycoides]